MQHAAGLACESSGLRPGDGVGPFSASKLHGVGGKRSQGAEMTLRRGRSGGMRGPRKFLTRETDTLEKMGDRK